LVRISNGMPIVTIHHKESASSPELLRLRQVLPEVVSRAVECPEEPYDGTLKPGDINLLSAASLGPDEGLDYLIEVKTRRTETRTANLQERADRIAAALGALELQSYGVWLELHEAGWAQTD